MVSIAEYAKHVVQEWGASLNMVNRCGPGMVYTWWEIVPNTE